MAHFVKCYYCGEKFDRDKEEWAKVTANRYAHKKCALTKEEIQSQEDKDKEELNEYIIKLFNLDFVEPRIEEISFEKGSNIFTEFIEKIKSFF